MEAASAEGVEGAEEEAAKLWGGGGVDAAELASTSFADISADLMTRCNYYNDSFRALA